ncbi:MAG TPA: hypothetical protein VFS67_01165 [Polyangiaceae bacterium]|jgi:hypothetical protein|nr:hypothetical protein [Polyangiaceae bacterium]
MLIRGMGVGLLGAGVYGTSHFAGTGPRAPGNVLFDLATPARTAVARSFGPWYDHSRRW